NPLGWPMAHDGPERPRRPKKRGPDQRVPVPRGLGRCCRSRQSPCPAPRRVAAHRCTPVQRGSRLEPLQAGLLPKERTPAIAAVSRSDAIQEAHGFVVEVTKAFGLEPIREDAKQQVPRQRLRRFTPEYGPPPGAQARKIDIT